MAATPSNISPRAFQLAAFAIIGWLALRVIAGAWVADDAYITFRVVDNIVNGFGATWNTDERVQAYTHPLWMLLHVPFHFVFSNVYLTTLLLSFTVFTLAVTQALRAIGRPLHESALLFLLPLSLSVPVMEYAASGLENPLTMLLSACFALVLFTGDFAAAKSWRRLSFISALLILTRMDLVLLIAPAWLWVLYAHPKKHWRAAALAAWPLVLWYGFSLIYYGFLFPNTKYAKLNTGIPEWEMVQQGAYYFVDLFVRDMLSCFALLALIAYIATAIWKYRSIFYHRALPLALGACIYMAYIVAVGGDFMGGRFWVTPLFVTFLLFARLLPRDLFHSRRQTLVWAGTLLVLAGSSAIQRERVWQEGCGAIGMAVRIQEHDAEMCALHGIIDERRYYLPMTGFIKQDLSLRLRPGGPWVSEGLELRATGHRQLQVQKVIGLKGFYAGPHVVIIDIYALSEPLLARLPVNRGKWRIGHFERDFPEGFLLARKTGDVSLMPASLGEYYRQLRLVTSAPLWDGERLKALMGFQQGRFEKLRLDYLAGVSADNRARPAHRPDTPTP